MRKENILNIEKWNDSLFRPFCFIFMMCLLLSCPFRSVAQNKDSSKAVLKDSSNHIITKKIIGYFVFSFPLGLGLELAYRPFTNFAIMSGVGVGIPVPYISGPGILMNIGASYGINQSDTLNNEFALNLYYTYQFEPKENSKISLMFGKIPSSNSNFRWGLGVQVFDKKNSLIGLSFGHFAILPALTISLRIH